MSVLVTGAGGFIGGHVARVLTARGETVRGLDLAWPNKVPGIICETGSILDQQALRQAMRGIDRVVHCAAIADLWTRQRFDYDRVNVLGTCLVAAEARRARARMVHVSSYTTLIGQMPPPVIDETLEIVPNRLLGPYPRSKRQAELAVRAAVAAGLDAVMVLPGAPIGPGDTRLTPPMRMIRDLAAGTLPALVETRLDLVDVAVLAEGIVAALDHGATGARYLLGGEDLALGELAGRIADLTGRAAPERRVPMPLALAAARVEAGIARLTGRPPTAPLTGVRLAARPVRLDSAAARRAFGWAPPPLDLGPALDWLASSGHLPDQPG